MNWELNERYRAHLLAQESAFLELLRYLYTEAQVPHPFDEHLTALMGRFERPAAGSKGPQRTPQLQVQGNQERPHDTPTRRLRRGAGAIA